VAILPDVASGFTESVMEIDYVRLYQEAIASAPKVGLEEVQIYPNPLKTRFDDNNYRGFVRCESNIL
jgi:hypothetical protein